MSAAKAVANSTSRSNIICFIVKVSSTVVQNTFTVDESLSLNCRKEKQKLLSFLTYPRAEHHASTDYRTIMLNPSSMCMPFRSPLEKLSTAGASYMSCFEVRCMRPLSMLSRFDGSWRMRGGTLPKPERMIRDGDWRSALLT